MLGIDCEVSRLYLLMQHCRREVILEIDPRRSALVVCDHTAHSLRDFVVLHWIEQSRGYLLHTVRSRE